MNNIYKNKIYLTLHLFFYCSKIINLNKMFSEYRFLYVCTQIEPRFSCYRKALFFSYETIPSHRKSPIRKRNAHNPPE